VTDNTASETVRSCPEDTVIEQTRHWLKDVVIDLNLCPFASRPFKQDRIHYQLLSGKNIERHLQQIAGLFHLLDRNADIETALLVFPDSYHDFTDYLDLLGLANALLEDLEYSGIYQLASFHPNYHFEDSNSDDAANFSNRSPWPMLHLLRESSIGSAVSGLNQVHEIPEINIGKLRKLGFSALQKKLDGIRGLKK